ncbi:MAG TPA: tetratricopeptide repeat protein [Blastocatellia bacterium]|jgi:tetratricopeptide (TPR) repeat protein|nr:tetratricopeptide repeat protein [Blastocatellia bacterium]
MKTRRELLEEFLTADPNDSFSRYALALELEKENRPLEAIEQLQEVIARDANYVAAYYHLGRILGRMGQIEDARAIYHRGLDAAVSTGDQKTRGEIQEALELLD